MLEYWIALSVVKNMGLSVKHELLKKSRSPDKVFEEKVKKSDFARMKGDIDLKTVKDECLYEAESIIRRCRNENAEIICFDDVNYPKLLKEISTAPLVLYCKGDKKVLSQRCIAVVGTREPSDNGVKDTKMLSAGLAKAGLVIVSGLARGVDTFAHNSAVETGGKTIAVMATGINKIHPVQNIGLAQKIANGGGILITEQPPDETPFAPNFVQRNRIISGICECTIIVSAPEKSGALITGDFAERHGRKVLVVPGTISDEKYKGSNKLLLKKNVDPALAIDGILSYLNGVKAVRQIEIFDIPEKIPVKKIEVSQTQEKIISLLENEQSSVQDLSEKSGMGVGELCDVLFDLEMTEIVSQTADGKYFVLR
jgi:DNA processing protein